MFEDIKKNKRKSIFIVFGFVLIITLILYYICMAFDLSAPIAIIIALTFSIIASWASYYNSDKIILFISKARPATEEENKKYLHRERKMYGKIERSFHLEDIDEDSITAEFKDGILTIAVDKIDEDKNKKFIEVK